MSDYSEFAGDGANDFNEDFTGDQQAPVQNADNGASTGGSSLFIGGSEKSFEDVYRSAFVGFANAIKMRNDPTHDVVENPDLIELTRDEAFDFLFRIGQPEPQNTFQLDGSDIWNCNDLYDQICDYGIDTKPIAEKFATLLNISQLVQGMSRAVISPEARGKKGEMTRILLGEVKGEGKSSITTEISSVLSSSDSEIFKKNPDLFFITEATLELTNSQAKQWCKDIISNAVNILSITSRQFVGSTLSVLFSDPSPTHLTIKFLGEKVDEITRSNLTFVLIDLSNALFPIGFTTEWKWAVSFDEILDIPLSQLLQSEVSLSLPSIGFSPMVLGNLKEMIPLNLFDVETFEQLSEKIPGLNDIVNGNLSTTLDLRNFVETIISKALGGEDKLKNSTLLTLIGDWAPLGFALLTPFLSNDLTLTDVISALRSLVALGRLVFARDFNNFQSFRAVCLSGHSFSFTSNNVFKVESLFKALDNVFEKLSEIADQLPPQDAAQAPEEAV